MRRIIIRRGCGGGGGRGGGGGVVSPATILGPLLHADFDAADPGITLAAGKVASIPNRGTDSAAMVQAMATLQPAYGATSFAGGPGMTFDRVDDTMACAFATAIPSGRRPMLWVVFQAVNTLTTDQIVASLEGSTPTRYLVAWSNRSPTALFSGAVVPTLASGGSALIAPTETTYTHLLEVANTVGGTAAVRLDGAAADVAATAVTDVTMSVVRLGAYTGVTQFSGCIVRRLIVANDLPSDAQITAMRAYLRAQPYSLVSQTPPLPASTVEYWHSELGCSPSAWVGRLQGLSLTGVGAPTVAVDGTNFRGRPVAQAAIGGNHWRATGLPSILAASSRPWMAAAARYRTSATTQTGFGTAGAAEQQSCSLITAANFQAFMNATVVNDGAVNTTPHRFKWWWNGTTPSLTVDATTTSSVGATSIGQAITTVSVGVSAAAAANPANLSAGFLILCSSTPTAAEEAALDTWMQAYWGVP